MNLNSHRICIIGNPRCGSHYVLDAIKIITGIDNSMVHLDEPFTFDDTEYNTPELINNAIAIELAKIESVPTHVGILFSFFNQDNIDNPYSIIQRLKAYGFKFFVLKRDNIEEQLISYATAYESDIWVKVNTSDKVDYGLNNTEIMLNVNIGPDAQEATSFLFNKLKNFDKFISTLDIEYTDISYDTAMIDLAVYFGTELQLYDGKYIKQAPADMYSLITNKEETQLFINELISGKYQIDQILKRSKVRRKGRFDIKDTICRFAWDYSVLNLARNELRACCRTVQTKVSDEDFKRGTDIFTGFIPIIEIRKALLRGEKHDHCESCWAIEDKADPKLKARGFINSARSGFDDFVDYVYSLRNYPETNTMNFWANKTKEEIAYQLTHINEEEIDKFIRIDHHYLIELNLGNTCDLKCVYCNHHYSSQWAAEKLRYKEISINEIETELPKIKDTVFEDIFWKWFYERKAFDADAINFIGGEPLIIEKFYTYTDRIVKFYETDEKRKRFLELGVVSNFNTPPKQYAKFKDTCFSIITSKNLNLDFNVSCESIGDRAEFIRTGTNWKLMSANIEDFMSFLDAYDIDENGCSKVLFNLQIAMNSLCVSDLPAFFTFFCELNKRYKHNVHFRPNHIVWPSWMNPDILPVEYVKYIDISVAIINKHLNAGELDTKNYSKYGKWFEYLGFLHSIKTGIENPNKDLDARKHFAYNIDKLCARRNLDFHNTFPEMIPFYNECKDLLIADTSFVPTKF